MNQSLRLLVAPLALVLGAGSAAVISTGQRSHVPVYTLAELRAGLVRNPAAWVGRAVRVRGMVQSSGCLAWDAGGSAPCRDRAAYLLGPDGASVLQVAGWERDPLLATLRRLPLVGRLVPGPRAARWGALATYRVRLQAAPAPVCDDTPCYEVFLLDAAPW
jgi:hypothetical protein